MLVKAGLHKNGFKMTLKKISYSLKVRASWSSKRIGWNGAWQDIFHLLSRSSFCVVRAKSELKIPLGVCALSFRILNDFLNQYTQTTPLTEMFRDWVFEPFLYLVPGGRLSTQLQCQSSGLQHTPQLLYPVHTWRFWVIPMVSHGKESHPPMKLLVIIMVSYGKATHLPPISLSRGRGWSKGSPHTPQSPLIIWC